MITALEKYKKILKFKQQYIMIIKKHLKKHIDKFNNKEYILTVLTAIKPQFINELHVDNIFNSITKSLVVEWIKDYDVFSLEIHNNKISYCIISDNIEVYKAVEVRHVDIITELNTELGSFLKLRMKSRNVNVFKY